jgi:alpha-L-arabinofuranosidase
LIGYDALSSFGSPSYYAQQMFSRNRGDVVLPVDLSQPVSDAAPAVPAPKGGIGVATWLTQAEFKDIKVTGDAGQTLYQKDFAQGANDWKLGAGTWAAQDGVLRQTSEATDCRATAGDPNWTDYTYTLKARKIAGAEGFLFLFHAQDAANYVWWNVGGWGNTRTGLERSRDGVKTELGRSAPVTVETGRWYDVRIEVKGQSIRCFLDGKLVTTAVDSPTAGAEPIYATASRDNKNGDVILKVVNVAADPQPMQIDLQGARNVAANGTAQVLTGEPQEQNTLDQPQKIVPAALALTGVSRSFVHQFPGHSVTVLRVKAR